MLGPGGPKRTLATRDQGREYGRLLARRSIHSVRRVEQKGHMAGSGVWAADPRGGRACNRGGGFQWGEWRRRAEFCLFLPGRDGGLDSAPRRPDPATQTLPHV